jgi:hypothetical protein
MALTENKYADKVETLLPLGQVQVRMRDSIERDGAEIASSFSRYVLVCGSLSEDGQSLVPTDLSDQPAEVAAIATGAWTPEVQAAYVAFLQEQAAAEEATEPESIDTPAAPDA